MPQSFKIVVLAGDHIGKDVTAESVKILKVLQPLLSKKGIEIEFKELLTGGDAIDAFGSSLPDSVFDECVLSDAILFGSIGGTKHDSVPGGPRNDSLLHLRKRFDLYCNVRPCKLASKALKRSSPLKPELLENVNIITLRENCGGGYFGQKVECAGPGAASPFAMDETLYKPEEVERIAKSAANLAHTIANELPSAVGPKLECKVTSVDKANVMATSRLWRRTVTKTLGAPGATIPNALVPPPNHFLADAMTFLLMLNPSAFNGVVVMDNLFGDLISDESAAICGGSLGVMPSASLCGWPVEEREFTVGGKSIKKKCPGLYEPVHGSAPDISGKGIANPMGSILSLAMLFRFSLNLPDVANIIEKSVQKVLDDTEDGGFAMRTPDIQPRCGGQSVGTAAFGAQVIEVVKDLWEKGTSRM